MFKKYGLIIFITSVVSVLVTVLTITYILSNEKSVVYVDSTKIFNDFRMTKELTISGNYEFKKQASALDSLYAIMEISKDNMVREQLVKKIIDQRKSVENFQSTYTVTTTQNVWKRINGYLKDFSKQEGFHIIIGSENTSGIFTGDERLDVTKDALMYVNKRYEGIN